MTGVVCWTFWATAAEGSSSSVERTSSDDRFIEFASRKTLNCKTHANARSFAKDNAVSVHSSGYAPRTVCVGAFPVDLGTPGGVEPLREWGRTVAPRGAGDGGFGSRVADASASRLHADQRHYRAPAADCRSLRGSEHAPHPGDERRVRGQLHHPRSPR